MPAERSRVGMLSPIVKAVKNYPLASFFVLTFAISWAMWLSVWMTGKGVVLYTYPLLLIGVFGPFISAFTMTYLQSGMVGVRKLAGRLLQWRESLRWYAVSLFLIPAMMLVAIGLNVAIGGQVGHSSWLQWWLPLILPLALVTGIITGGPLAEEPGWRGFALPRLQAKFGPLAGGLALGLIWCCWHIPLFFIKGSSQYGLPFALWAVYTMALSLLMVWVYNRSNGSILIMMLFHASSNIAITVLPVLPQMSGGWNTAYIYIAIVTLVMIAIILWNWRDMMVKKPIDSRNSA
jgi:uncharacterized protein